MNNKIINNMRKNEKLLSKYAALEKDAIRLKDYKEDIRSNYFRDIDRIIYSLAYSRYIDKTQVFSNIDNDMISKRMTHIQMVSKIARTIGRALNLNEDLIEAASLGHDLGHVPFGHAGEKILNEISLKNNQGFFFHNVQSARTLMYLENHGKGNNISVQVLDAILCHNGEKLKDIYTPSIKTKEDFLNEYNNSYFDEEIIHNLRSMTLEGCVVRISDIIAYIGKDIEDAIRLGVLKEEEIPNNIINKLGKTNREIVNTIILDIIDNSLNKNYIKLSPEIYNAINELLDFNYKNIYHKANDLDKLNEYKNMFNKLFVLYVKQLNNKETNTDIYTIFINDMIDEYIVNSSNERIAIDFIAGMTDDFFIDQYNKNFK